MHPWALNTRASAWLCCAAQQALLQAMTGHRAPLLELQQCQGTSGTGREFHCVTRHSEADKRSFNILHLHTSACRVQGSKWTGYIRQLQVLPKSFKTTFQESSIANTAYLAR